MEKFGRALAHSTLLFVLVLNFSSSSALAAGSGNTSAVQQRPLGDEVSSILNQIRVGYDKRVRPNYGGEPVTVGITMYILGIFSVSEVDMDFTMDFYFRQTWNDPRLKFKGPPGVPYLSVGTEYLRSIWMPSTFFVNEKKTYFHTVTTNNEEVRISENGDVFRSIRLSMTASCPMDLRYFPMDKQRCSLEIENYGSSMKDIRFKWAKGASSVGISSDSLPQFKVLGHAQKSSEISLTTGNYSRLICEIEFARSLGYYLIQIYLPAVFLVILSWVSFWINRDATTARVLMGLMTFLTMTTLMSSTNAALPKISYIKAVDVYLGVCLIMVFASLLEYVTVGYITKQIKMLNKIFLAEGKGRAVSFSRGIGVLEDNGKCGDVENSADSMSTEKVTKLYDIAPSDLDKYSRLAFPAFFIFFNLIYWIYYLN